MHQAPGGGAPGQIVSTTPHPSIARIIVPEKDGQSYGSGTLVDVRGQHALVVTNWHVVRDASAEITVVFPDDFRSPAQVVKVDADWDLAALSILRPTTAMPVPISAAAPKPGEPLTIAGYGSGDYRAAAGVCTQYLAPSERHPYELVELAAEARQGDSGGPILNERGELAGVLFGSGPGYTSGSYSGRVREFLSSVMSTADAVAGQAIASNAPVPQTNVPNNSLEPTNTSLQVAQAPPAENDPRLLPLTTTPVGGPAEGAPRPVEIGMGLAQPATPSAATPLPVAPIPDEPLEPAKPVPLIAESSEAFESEPPLTPVHSDSGGWRKRVSDDDDDYVDPRTAVVVDRSRTADRFDDEDDRIASAPAKLRRLDDTPLPKNRLAEADDDRSSMDDRRLAIVPHSPLPPRQGVAPPEIAHAPADQLLAAVWQRVGGTTFWDQSKTVLAMIGILTLVIQFWRLNRHQDAPPEAD